MGKRNIDEWEAALIKTMLMSGKYTRDRIVSYFTRPDRTVNPFRINEIANGDAFADVEPAAQQQVDIYLKRFRVPDEARRGFFEGNPLHPVNLRDLLSLRPDTDELIIEETDRVECKEGLNFLNKSLYGKVIVSLANARGGILLFGVRDHDRKVVGIKAGRLNKYDPAKFNQYLASTFSPVPLWEKAEIEIAGNVVGIIHVPQAEERPIICTKDDAEVREGDIYYRYPGESRRIKHAELIQILRSCRSETERQWQDVLQRVRRVGVENVAILDTKSGEVSGRSGRFFIDEELIPKLKFVAEGRFNETEGEPTLHLLGSLEPIAAIKSEGVAEIVDQVHLTDDDLMEAFLDQTEVANPALYVAHAAHSAKKWLPTFYFMRQAEFTKGDAVELLQQQRGARPFQIDTQSERIMAETVPAGAAKPASAEPTRGELLAQTFEAPTTNDEAKQFLKALRTLEPQEADANYLLPHLKIVWERFKDGNLHGIAYAASHLDVIWHQQLAS